MGDDIRRGLENGTIVEESPHNRLLRMPGRPFRPAPKPDTSDRSGDWGDDGSWIPGGRPTETDCL